MMHLTVGTRKDVQLLGVDFAEILALVVPVISVYVGEIFMVKSSLLLGFVLFYLSNFLVLLIITSCSATSVISG
jgi:hypothetical protein